MPRKRKLAGLAVGALTTMLLSYLTTTPARGAVPDPAGPIGSAGPAEPAAPPVPPVPAGVTGPAGSTDSTGSTGSTGRGGSGASSRLANRIDPAVAALMRRQEPLLDAVDQLDALFDVRDSGYAGVRIDVPKRSVHLYWHGKVPAEVSALAVRMNGPRRKVTVTAAPYTFGQLQAAADRLMAADHGIVQVRIANDGTGLHAVVNRSPEGVRPRSVHSSVATTVERGSPMEPMTRWGDVPPFWGGAVIANSTSDCTSGFAASSQGGTVDGIVTASHCGAGPWETPFANPIGNVTDDAVAQGYDMEFITTSSAAFVYLAGSDITGNGVGETDDPVSSLPSGATPAGTMICTDGAFSGEICDAQSDGAINYTLSGNPTTFHGVLAHQIAGTNLSGNGDSGGPVVTLLGSSVRAEGIISGGDPSTTVRCTGVPVMRTCTSSSVYVPIGPAIAAMNTLLLITSP